jgi:CTP:molybdopterin cytidylyltransferase MocA
MIEMKDTTLVILAAGLGSRFGGNKQISHVGPHDEILMEYSIHDALAAGFTQVTQKGKLGYKAEAYKVRWDADGDRISRELLCRSTYKSVTEIIEYGP